MKLLCTTLIGLLLAVSAHAQMDTIYFNSFKNWTTSTDGWLVIDNDTNSNVANHIDNIYSFTASNGYTSIESLDDMAGLFKVKGKIDQIMITPPLQLGSDPWLQLYSWVFATPGTASIQCWVLPNPNNTSAAGITDSLKVLNTDGYNSISLGAYANSTVRLAFKIKMNPIYTVQCSLAIDDILVFNKQRLAYIPDNALRNHLMTTIPAAFVGDSLNYVSAAAVGTTQIVANSMNIQNLEGIQYFPGLRIFKAHHNQITEFPTNRMPYIDTLNVSYNQITALPDMPRATRLYFDHNLVHSFPDYYNNAISRLYGNNNLLYGCMPCSNRFVVGSVLNNLPLYVPCTYYSLQYTYVSASSVPPCITDKSHVQGSVYADLNNNGLRESTEPRLPYQPIQFTQSTDFVTNASGMYHMVAESAQMNLDVTSLPPYFTCVNPLDTVLAAGENIAHDFRIVATQQVADVQITITRSTPYTTNNLVSFNVLAKNLGSVTSTVPVRIALPPGSVVAVSNYGTVLNDTLYWDVTLTPFQQIGNSFGLSTLTLAANVYPVSASATVAADINVSNNADVAYFQRTADPQPHDPNYKLASDPVVDTGFFDYETYTIRFENTGAGNATYVAVRDQLPAMLDPTTFEYLGSTHPATVDYGTDNTIQFTFNNITLTPKSVDSTQSFGFIWFKIKPTEPLQLYDTIKNRASIIFNTQAPIVTEYSLVYVDPNRVASNTIADNASFCKGDVLHFSDQSNAFPISVQWKNLSDASAISNLFTDSLVLDSAGVFEIQQVVLWETGQRDTLVKTINVHGPTIHFNAIPNVCRAENALALEFATPAGGQYSGTGITNNVLNATQLSSGTYTLTYSVTDAYGCEVQRTSSFMVEDDFVSSESQTICSGETINWRGLDIAATGTYSVNLTRASGCDSTFQLNLTVLDEIETSENLDLCDGSSVVWHGQNISLSGEYQEVMQSAAGCDSTLNLSVQLRNNYSTLTQQSICSGNTLTWEGQNLFEAGEYAVTYLSQFGCDSVLRVNLTILPEVNQSTVLHACNGEQITWENQLLTTPGEYQVIYQNLAGCDSIRNLNLIYHSPFNAAASQSICYGSTLDWEGSTLNETGTYTMTYQTTYGCDSIVQMNLTILPEVNEVSVLHACNGEQITWENQLLNAAGQYQAVYQNVAGCDSIRNLNLIYHSPFNASTNESICFGSTLDWEGSTLNETGTYTMTYETTYGCDSIVQMNLTVLPEVTESATTHACEGDQIDWQGQVLTSPGNYEATYPNAFGCDSVLHLELIYHSWFSSSQSESICPGSTLEWEGMELNEAGTYTMTYQTQYGCDSIVNLDLTVSDEINPVLSAQENVLTATTGMDTYSWIDCTTGTVLSTGSSNAFEVSADGTYAVVVTHNNCTDTSACLVVDYLSVDQNVLSNVLVYPNPFNDQIVVASTNEIGALVTYELTSSTGQLIERGTLSSDGIIHVDHLAIGMYVLKLESNSFVKQFSLIHQ